LHNSLQASHNGRRIFGAVGAGAALTPATKRIDRAPPTTHPANRLTFGIYPREEITLTFQAKSPGAAACLRNVKMHFDYQEGDEGIVLEAYEKVLVDCLHGDQMLFWRQDGVELCWSFLTPILGECETCEDRVERLHFYEAGSRGPRAGLAMLPDPGVLGG